MQQTMFTFVLSQQPRHFSILSLCGTLHSFSTHLVSSFQVFADLAQLVSLMQTNKYTVKNDTVNVYRNMA